MTYSCRRNRDSKMLTDDLKITRAYSSGFEKERNIIYHPDYSEENESIESKAFAGEANICSEVVFFDGNEADFEASEDEDTLIERVWSLSEPPKIPRHTCVVPARRIQVIKERLSSTVKGLSTLSEALRVEMKKNLKRRINSDIEYLNIRSFDETKLASCQTDTINIIPNCARTLEELL